MLCLPYHHLTSERTFVLLYHNKPVLDYANRNFLPLSLRLEEGDFFRSYVKKWECSQEHVQPPKLDEDRLTEIAEILTLAWMNESTV